MPTLDDVYRKFGEVSEAAQLLETDVGTVMMFLGAVDQGLISPELKVDSQRAARLMDRINRQTLGQLIRTTQQLTDAFGPIETLLAEALDERNRLAHCFYRQHNLRKFSNKGRAIMMNDLESMHEVLLAAWKAVNMIQGIDLDALVKQMDEATEQSNASPSDVDTPIRHLKI